MRRHFQALNEFGDPVNQVPNGVFLVRVERAQYISANKAFYVVRLVVCEPEEFASRVIVSRLYSTERAMWKLFWFLRDFGYDPDLLARGEVDDQRVRGLQGIVRASHAAVNGRPSMNLDAFAPAANWVRFRDGYRGQEAS